VEQAQNRRVIGRFVNYIAVQHAREWMSAPAIL
jgi:hypothetical protein